MATYSELKTAIETHSIEVVRASVALGHCPTRIEDSYVGHFDSVTDYARELMDDTGELDNTGVLAAYFDFEKFGRDMELNGDISEHEGHIFYGSY